VARIIKLMEDVLIDAISKVESNRAPISFAYDGLKRWVIRLSSHRPRLQVTFLTSVGQYWTEVRCKI